MPIRFAIVCLGRSGSTHLQSLLDSHPDVRCFGELFSDRAPAHVPAFIHSRHDDPGAYLRELIAGVEQGVVGFKLPMNSIRAHPGSAGLVRDDSELRVIRLSRRNHLAQLISRRMQAETGVSHSIEGSYDAAIVRIEPQRCLDALERMEADERELDELARGKPTFPILYEDLAAGRDLDEVQRFLGVEPRSLRSWFTKLRTRPLSGTIENWDELAAALTDTRYEAFLGDDL